MKYFELQDRTTNMLLMLGCRIVVLIEARAQKKGQKLEHHWTMAPTQPITIILT